MIELCHRCKLTNSTIMWHQSQHLPCWCRRGCSGCRLMRTSIAQRRFMKARWFDSRKRKVGAGNFLESIITLLSFEWLNFKVIIPIFLSSCPIWPWHPWRWRGPLYLCSASVVPTGGSGESAWIPDGWGQERAVTFVITSLQPQATHFSYHFIP